MRKRLLAIALTAGAIGVSAFAGSGPALAAEGGTITETGWWSRNPAANAPEEGLNVSNAADGPVAVAAVKISASTALQDAVLVLPEDGGIQADSAKLQVCTTPNDWSSGPNQAWADAPRAECESEGSVELTRTASSSTWAADVTSLLSDIEEEGSVSLMIVPAGAATVPVAFEVRFQAPTFTSKAAASSTTGDAFAGSTEYAPAGGSATSSDVSSSSASTSGGESGNSSFGSATFVPSNTAPTAVAAPAAPVTADGAAGASSSPATDAAAPSSGPAEFGALPTQADIASSSSGNSTVQALFFVVLATIAGVGAGAGRYMLRRRSDDFSAFA